MEKRCKSCSKVYIRNQGIKLKQFLKSKYCSITCKRIGTRKLGWKKLDLSPKSCENCKTLIYKDKSMAFHIFAKRKYCSTKCHAISQIISSTGEKNSNWRGGLPNCKICYKKLSNKKNKSSRCSECYIKTLHGETHPNWQGGFSSTKKAMTFYSLIKRERWRGAKGSHTLVEWEALKMKYRYMCLCCKRCEPEIKLTRDHIVPIIKGGENYISNIQPLCKSCNSIKHTKIVDYTRTNTIYADN